MRAVRSSVMSTLSLDSVRFPAVDVVRTARIAQVVPSVNPMTRTFSVIVSLPNPDHAIPPGMFAKARIVESSACPAEPPAEAGEDEEVRDSASGKTTKGTRSGAKKARARK